METKIDYVGALACASYYYEFVRDEVAFNKPGAVRALTAFGLFTPREMAEILDTSIETVKKHMGMHVNTSWSARKPAPPKALSLLGVIARQWRDGEDTDMLVARAAMYGGVSVRTIHELTGVSLEKVRAVVW